MNTFWAILLDNNPLNSSTLVHVGWGSHLSLSVAAVRAITEAAQTRLTYIHGARENLAANLRAFSGDQARRVFAFFDRFESDTDWHALNDMASNDLIQDYLHVLTSLGEAGFARVFRVNLTRSPFNIPVTKVLVPGLQMKPGLF
jgi:ribosomal protein S12 methylthiotransferase accessory factor